MRPEELGHLERFSVGSRLHALGRVSQNRSLLMSWHCSFVLPVPIVPHWCATVVLGNAPQSQLRFFLDNSDVSLLNKQLWDWCSEHSFMVLRSVTCRESYTYIQVMCEVEGGGTFLGATW